MQYSIFGSILAIGAMIGALSCGRIADTIGRKGVRTETHSLLLLLLWLNEPTNFAYQIFLTTSLSGGKAYNRNCKIVSFYFFWWIVKHSFHLAYFLVWTQAMRLSSVICTCGLMAIHLAKVYGHVHSNFQFLTIIFGPKNCV